MEGKFSRTEMLIGNDGMEKLANAKVAVFGIGGVGSFVCEGLARSGVGNFVLVDFDKIDESNINRQIIAMENTIGKYKVDLMKRLGISRATFSELLDENLMSAKKATLTSDIETINSTIAIAEKDILTSDETEMLVTLLVHMKQKLIDNYQREWLEYQAKCLERFTIDHIKKTLAAKEGVPVNPVDTGLNQTFEEFSSIHIATEKIKRCLSSERTLPPVLIGNLSSKGPVKLVTHIGIKNQPTDSHPKEWTRRKYIDSSATQQMFFEFSRRLNSVHRTLLSTDCAVEIANLKSYMAENGITSLRKFVNYLNVLTNDYSSDFKPSNGEQSILLVDAALNNRDCDVILLDEPDSGMGADYINDILIPEVIEKESTTYVRFMSEHADTDPDPYFICELSWHHRA